MTCDTESTCGYRSNREGCELPDLIDPNTQADASRSMLKPSGCSGAGAGAMLESILSSRPELDVRWIFAD